MANAAVEEGHVKCNRDRSFPHTEFPSSSVVEWSRVSSAKEVLLLG